MIEEINIFVSRRYQAPPNIMIDFKINPDIKKYYIIINKSLFDYIKITIRKLLKSRRFHQSNCSMWIHIRYYTTRTDLYLIYDPEYNNKKECYPDRIKLHFNDCGEIDNNCNETEKEFFNKIITIDEQFKQELNRQKELNGLKYLMEEVD